MIPVAIRVFLLLIAFTGAVSARVWYIKPDGSGDAPHIQAGIDSSAAGDTVLVAQGYYDDAATLPGGCYDFKGKAIVVKAEHGPESTWIVSDSGFRFHSGEDSLSVLEGFGFSGQGPAVTCVNASPTIRGNIFDVYTCALSLRGTSSRVSENHLAYAVLGIHCVFDSSTIANNVIVGDDYSTLIKCEDSFNRIVGNEMHGMTLIHCVRGSYAILENELCGPYDAVGIRCEDATAIIMGNASCIIQPCVSVDGGTYAIEYNTIGRGAAPPAARSTRRTNQTILPWDRSGLIQCRNVDASTTIRGNILLNNTLEWDGGVIDCINASPVISENVITGNYSESSRASAICCERSSPAIISNTIADNSLCSGAVYCSDQSSPEIRQNIIANTTPNPWSDCESSPGICVADTSCHPHVACNDVFNNFGGNYAGIADQTGVNGNISMDPLFCGPHGGGYKLHALSPCLLHRHPDGADCGVIGALGLGCSHIATLLRDYEAKVEASGIVITWRLSEAGNQMDFVISRAELPGTEYGEISDASIVRDGLSFLFKDRTCSAGSEYRYRVEAIDESGRRLLFETDPLSLSPLRLALYQNYPNPCNPSTRISYRVPDQARVVLEIYDVSGRRIARVVDEEQERGLHTAEWDGKTASGSQATSGVYLLRLSSQKESISRKLILVR